MPKLKTNKSAAKRLKITKSGKIKRWKSFTGHLKTGKSPGRRRKLRSSTLVSVANLAKTKMLLPYD
ncbi:50S ribosomal protein L35 [candidate division WOR-3 bacterium]|nr:50S ribosomal protein L35 [candidate division WOR-3 bacterium]